MITEPAKIQMLEVTGLDELTRARQQREQFDRNSAWLQAHVSEIYAKYRGMCICIAGQEVFTGASAKAAIARGMAAHPEDAGWFTRYIAKEKVARLYAV